jgi:phosphoglycerate dehydrogenase-like enzyme
VTTRVVVLDDYQSAAESRADWAGLDVDFVHEHLVGDALLQRLAGAPVVVAMRERTPFPRSVLEQLPELRLLVTTGMRNASIDVGAARELGITVSGTGMKSGTAAELAWALILGLAKNVAGEDARIRAGGWQQTVGADLAGETLGLVGLGRLGAKVAAVGTALGMDVIAWSPHLTAERAAEGGARLAAKDELFAASRFISLHLVLGESTREIVGAAELRLMPPDAYLVNTARAGLVDQAALRRALDEGWIAGAGLDVYDEEPLPADHWLRTSPRTLLSPHMGYVTDGSFRVSYPDAVEDIRAFLEGTPLRELP